MKLSTKGQYAVMALVDLAMRGNGGSLPLPDIAVRQNMSLSYLEQLFARLKRHALVISVRGQSGGYALSRGANDITIADIFRAADEPIRAARCGGKKGGCSSRTLKEPCLTHDLWSELENRITGYLSSVTLADVCQKSIAPKAVCTRPCHTLGAGRP